MNGDTHDMDRLDRVLGERRVSRRAWHRRTLRRLKSTKRWRGLGVLVVAGVVTMLASSASGVEVNFAGSAQLDYLAVPTRGVARGLTFDGFTTELSLKLSADLTDAVSMNVKTCFGCHGFEVGQAFADVRIDRAFNIRVGRFTPQFGDFPLRHDPANHKTSDKPLPYDMGRMLRLREFNMGVLPAPHVDNGIELFGSVEISESLDFDYAVSVFGGLRGSSDGVDLDFIQSRSPALYYVDNNSTPSVAGRVGIAARFEPGVSLKIGGSAMWGLYDPDNELDYLLVGVDLSLRVHAFRLYAEYLIRRTKMGLGDSPQTRFLYGPGSDGTYDPYMLKDGWYVTGEVIASDLVEIVARFDGLRRLGNVTTASSLRSESMVLRYTAGVNFVIERVVRVKLSAQFYDFSDFDDEVGLHVGLVGAF